MGAIGSRCPDHDPDSNGCACEAACCPEAIGIGVVTGMEPKITILLKILRIILGGFWS